MSVEELQALIEKQNQEFQAMREAFQSDLAEARAQAAGANVPAIAAVEEQADVGSIAVRLPSFWIASPELWFSQVEANFETRNPKITTDSSKYNHIMQALPQDVLNDCEHAVQAQGPDRYNKLKATLIKIYGKSPATKNAELLSLTAKPGGLGDRKPSSIMMKIRTLSGASYDAMERAMFLGQLPLTVRTALATSKARDNDELAAEADAIMEEIRLANIRNGVPHSVATVEASAVACGRSTNPRRPPAGFLCYLHRKFGASAYACRSDNCPMKDKVRPPPSAQGNGRAGR